MTKLEHAIIDATKAHKGQVDKQGEAYILHVLRVMFAVRKHTSDTDALVAAVLHDTVEDGHLLIEEIELSYGAKVAELVEQLTREKGRETYAQYIDRIRAYSDTRVQMIKSADLHDNLSRCVGASLEGLRFRYKKALQTLG